ncbi:MAG: YihA family ribosome biogenesis GTP-binding protein [Alistipes sp.]|nr:YihA family ribosome biogenesis GTP-binding protein [Candidatus Alistipes equi]
MIKKAIFKCSSEKLSQIPKDSLRDIAFIGRSNVGKSSLINMLTNHNGLAKTSSTPGKTKLINHFLVDDRWYLVDLPGYGYARASKRTSEKFQKIIMDYVFRCEKLHFLFVLVDIRLEPQPIDMEFISMLGQYQVPFAIIFTKCDKISAAQQSRQVQIFEKKLLETWEELPTMMLSSSLKSTGREDIVSYIENLIN